MIHKFSRYLLTLVALLTMTAGAWADGTVYNTTVELKDLKVGDVLTDGFSLTTATGQYINFKGYKKDGGSPVSDAYQQLDVNGVTFPGGVTISKSGSNYTPYADGKDANAWIVSDFKAYGSATMLYLDGYNYTAASAEPGIEVTTNAAEEGATFTEASFDMPAFDATVDYELVRDMTYQVNAYVGTTPDADYRHRVEKVDATTYWPVDITEEAQIIALFPVIDIIDAQNPKTLTYGTDYTLAIVDEQENEIDPADFDFAPGTYTVKVTGKGDYDGQIESLNKFELYFGYELTVGPGEFATFYKDEALTLDENETEAQLYTITAVGTETATATELTIAKANMPILVKNTSEEAKTILLIPTVDDADEVTAAEEFVGTLEATTIAASTSELTNYAFNGKQFVWVKDALAVEANKAWLAIPTGEATARTITLVFGDATGVNAVESGKWKVESFYDLNGRKLNGMPTKKGVYIMNGKKVVVK